MKKKLLIILFALLFGLYCQAQTASKQLEEFAMDLPFANSKLRGELMLFGDYKGDLTSLTYKNYLILLKRNEASSERGVAEIIKAAENHIFATKRNSFLIAIYSKKLNAVMYDDANTAFTDSIKVLQYNEKIPDVTLDQ
jgi:hypothetical protein